VAWRINWANATHCSHHIGCLRSNPQAQFLDETQILYLSLNIAVKLNEKKKEKRKMTKSILVISHPSIKIYG
jgi:hypothetical protein